MARFLCAMLMLVALDASGQCRPAGKSTPELTALKADDFRMDSDAERETLALALLACLADPDPSVRDGIAFEALAHWLRESTLGESARQTLLARLQARLQTDVDDPQGVGKPFAALVLSEVARTDHISAWMSPEQRTHVVEVAARYLEGIHDYRGFEPGVGWRHGVAHGADLALQLILNPAVDKHQIERLLAAIATQIAPSGEHAYIHGEPERLARPVLYAAVRGLHDPAYWAGWFDSAMVADPAVDGAAAFQSLVGLARRHNRQAFFQAVYVNSRDSDNPALAALAPLALEQLKALP